MIDISEVRLTELIKASQFSLIWEKWMLVTKVHKYASISLSNQESEYSRPSVYSLVLHLLIQPTAD